MDKWIKIKKDYIVTGLSYRKLSEKYGLSSTAIANKSKKENWVEQKEQNLHKSCTKLIQKSTENDIDVVSKMQAEERTKYDEVQDKIDKLYSKSNPSMQNAEIYTRILERMQKLRYRANNVPDKIENTIKSGSLDGVEKDLNDMFNKHKDECASQ